MVPTAGVGSVIPDADLRAAVASLIQSKLVGTRGFVERTGARGFLHLTSEKSRIGPNALAAVGAVSGGLRFSTPGRLVVIERGDAGYRVLVRARVASEVVVVYDWQHADLDGIGAALLDVLGAMLTDQ